MAYKVALNYFTGELQLVNGASSGSGNVTGIAPTEINAIARWADTTATTIKDSPNTFIQDSGAIESQGFITMRTVVGDTITVNSGETWITSSVEMGVGGVIILGPNAQLIMI